MHLSTTGRINQGFYIDGRNAQYIEGLLTCLRHKLSVGDESIEEFSVDDFEERSPVGKYYNDGNTDYYLSPDGQIVVKWSDMTWKKYIGERVEDSFHELYTVQRKCNFKHAIIYHLNIEYDENEHKWLAYN